jgi:hypothetical protein
VCQAAQILGGEEERSGEERRQEYQELLRTMEAEQASVGELEPAISHFVKVTRSYWSGLFHCYDVPELPRTNNDLEQTFGALRCADRRITGRKAASPGLVLRGPVRIVATVATKLHPFEPMDLCPRDLEEWSKLRQQLSEHEEARRLQRRFRRDPAAFLARAEQLILRQVLPR